MNTQITPAELIFMIFADEKKLAEKDLRQIRLGNDPAEEKIIYYTDLSGDERAVFLKNSLASQNLSLAKSQIFETPEEKEFSFSITKNEINFHFFIYSGNTVCIKKFYGKTEILISQSKEVGLNWIEDFMKEIRSKEVQITNKEETGEKFEPFVEILNNTAIELERLLHVFKGLILKDPELQPGSM